MKIGAKLLQIHAALDLAAGNVGGRLGPYYWVIDKFSSWCPRSQRERHSQPGAARRLLIPYNFDRRPPIGMGNRSLPNLAGRMCYSPGPAVAKSVTVFGAVNVAAVSSPHSATVVTWPGPADLREEIQAPR
jgi:hypothetical protein